MYVELETALASPSDQPRVVSIGDGRQDSVPGVTLEWLADATLMPGCEMTFGRAQLESGSSNPPHYHPNCHELLFVLEGTIEHPLGANSVTLTEGSLLHIPQGVMHNARNVGENVATLLVAYSSDRRETVFLDEPSA